MKTVLRQSILHFLIFGSLSTLYPSQLGTYTKYALVGGIVASCLYKLYRENQRLPVLVRTAQLPQPTQPLFNNIPLIEKLESNLKYHQRREELKGLKEYTLKRYLYHPRREDATYIHSTYEKEEYLKYLEIFNKNLYFNENFVCMPNKDTGFSTMTIKGELLKTFMDDATYFKPDIFKQLPKNRYAGYFSPHPCPGTIRDLLINEAGKISQELYDHPGKTNQTKKEITAELQRLAPQNTHKTEQEVNDELQRLTSQPINPTLFERYSYPFCIGAALGVIALTGQRMFSYGTRTIPV